MLTDQVKGPIRGRNVWRETAERAFKTGAQSLALVYAGDIANVLHVNYHVAFSAALGGFFLSVVTSIASVKLGAPDSPSAVKREP